MLQRGNPLPIANLQEQKLSHLFLPHPKPNVSLLTCRYSFFGFSSRDDKFCRTTKPPII